MPKETLALLDRDIERLLFAGARVARGDSDLIARREKLAALGRKAPALAKIVEQVEKTQKATGKNAASELLNLSAQMAQVRGAQASPAPAAGELAALPRAEPLESPRAPRRRRSSRQPVPRNRLTTVTTCSKRLHDHACRVGEPRVSAMPS